MYRIVPAVELFEPAIKHITRLLQALSLEQDGRFVVAVSRLKSDLVSLQDTFIEVSNLDTGQAKPFDFEARDTRLPKETASYIEQAPSRPIASPSQAPSRPAPAPEPSRPPRYVSPSYDVASPSQPQASTTFGASRPPPQRQ